MGIIKSSAPQTHMIYTSHHLENRPSHLKIVFNFILNNHWFSGAKMFVSGMVTFEYHWTLLTSLHLRHVMLGAQASVRSQFLGKFWWARWFNVTFFGWLYNWPVQRLSDLQPGDKRVTLNHLGFGCFALKQRVPAYSKRNIPSVVGYEGLAII